MWDASHQSEVFVHTSAGEDQFGSPVNNLRRQMSG